MKVLIASKFLHHVGGVETYVRWLANALVSEGVEVGLFGMTPPDGVEPMSFPKAPEWWTKRRSYEAGAPHRAQSALLSVYSPSAGSDMAGAIREFDPDLVHFHGTCYQLTPAVVRAATRARIPSVLTAHEFKLICANQTLFDDRRGEICTACVGTSPIGKVLSPLRRRCMKGSLPVTTLGAIEGRVADPIWKDADPRILAPSRFMRDLLLRDSWPQNRIDYLDLPWRPDDRVPQPGADGRENVVFLGRLAPVKGADRLLDAWAAVADEAPTSRLRILGDGAERDALERIVQDRGIQRVDFLGHSDAQTIDAELRRACVTVHPARWYENSPFSVRESLMAAVPAIVTDLGGMPEMVGKDSGWVVPNGNQGALTDTLRTALSSQLAGSERICEAVGLRAITETEHMNSLLNIYRQEVGSVRIDAHAGAAGMSASKRTMQREL